MTEWAKPASVAETLRAARALIEDPKHWIKGAEAQTSKRGSWVDARSPEAGAWCMIGALQAVDGPYEHRALALLAAVIRPDGFPDDIGDYNDAGHRRHRDVLAKFDRAIRKAESQP